MPVSGRRERQVTMKFAPHILVVTDDPDVGQILRTYLDEHAFRFSVVSSAHEMWDRLRSLEVHIIVLDILLPGSCGLDICRDF
jgi:DNA-binding response OmpR family regulator